MMISDDIGYLSDLDDRIREIFPVQLHGLRRFVSEYSVPYVTIANGYVKQQGEEQVRTTIHDALTHATEWFVERRKAGDDVLVWRQCPEIERDGAITSLYMRCHTMRSERMFEKLKVAA